MGKRTASAMPPPKVPGTRGRPRKSANNQQSETVDDGSPRMAGTSRNASIVTRSSNPRGVVANKKRRIVNVTNSDEEEDDDGYFLRTSTSRSPAMQKSNKKVNINVKQPPLRPLSAVSTNEFGPMPGAAATAGTSTAPPVFPKRGSETPLFTDFIEDNGSPVGQLRCHFQEIKTPNSPLVTLNNKSKILRGSTRKKRLFGNDDDTDMQDIVSSGTKNDANQGPENQAAFGSSSASSETVDKEIIEKKILKLFDNQIKQQRITKIIKRRQQQQQQQQQELPTEVETLPEDEAVDGQAGTNSNSTDRQEDCELDELEDFSPEELEEIDRLLVSKNNNNNSTTLNKKTNNTAPGTSKATSRLPEAKVNLVPKDGDCLNLDDIELEEIELEDLELDDLDTKQTSQAAANKQLSIVEHEPDTSLNISSTSVASRSFSKQLRDLGTKNDNKQSTPLLGTRRSSIFQHPPLTSITPIASIRSRQQEKSLTKGGGQVKIEENAAEENDVLDDIDDDFFDDLNLDGISDEDLIACIEQQHEKKSGTATQPMNFESVKLVMPKEAKKKVTGVMNGEMLSMSDILQVLESNFLEDLNLED